MNKQPKIGIKKQDFIDITSKLSDVLYSIQRLNVAQEIGENGPKLEELDNNTDLDINFKIGQEVYLLVKKSLDLLIENKNEI